MLPITRHLYLGPLFTLSWYHLLKKLKININIHKGSEESSDFYLGWNLQLKNMHTQFNYDQLISQANLMLLLILNSKMGYLNVLGGLPR